LNHNETKLVKDGLVLKIQDLPRFVVSYFTLIKYQISTQQKSFTCGILKGSNQGGQIINQMEPTNLTLRKSRTLMDVWTELGPDYF
jgi:hypothetical protein